ncbi:uncharacterized protein [Antedon mediterranea]|uniref:uncharacterized protein n=1 Tax=Antedon mediterranea TaxID=105859 RepID=UPI003AF572D5
MPLQTRAQIHATPPPKLTPMTDQSSSPTNKQNENSTPILTKICAEHPPADAEDTLSDDDELTQFNNDNNTSFHEDCKLAINSLEKLFIDMLANTVKENCELKVKITNDENSRLLIENNKLKSEIKTLKEKIKSKTANDTKKEETAKIKQDLDRTNERLKQLEKDNKSITHELKSLKQLAVDTTNFTTVNRNKSEPKSYANAVTSSNNPRNQIPVQNAPSSANRYPKNRENDRDRRHHAKPNVVIIGNSHLARIDPQRLLPWANIQLIPAYTIKDIHDKLKALDTNPDCILIHEITNSIKGTSATECAASIYGLLKQYANAHEGVDFIVSLGLPRVGELNYKIDIVNAEIKHRMRLENLKNLFFCDNSNFLRNGEILYHLLATDGYHLSTEGTSLLASNLKCKIKSVLKGRTIRRH